MTSPRPGLELWTLVPTPAKARHLRQSTVEQLLKRHRIRRIDAGTALRTLREPAIKVADGVAEAACIHMRSLVTRLRLVNRELRDAEGQLDKLCAAIGETEAAPGDCLRRQDVMILRSSVLQRRMKGGDENSRKAARKMREGPSGSAFSSTFRNSGSHAQSLEESI